MTEDDKALVERLRGDLPDKKVESHWITDYTAVEMQNREAANRIEALIAESERIKDRLGWICAVMDLDDDVSLQWIYTELEALRGLGEAK